MLPRIGVLGDGSLNKEKQDASRSWGMDFCVLFIGICPTRVGLVV